MQQTQNYNNFQIKLNSKIQKLFITIYFFFSNLYLLVINNLLIVIFWIILTISKFQQITNYIFQFTTNQKLKIIFNLNK